jgi:magnesium transporter
MTSTRGITEIEFPSFSRSTVIGISVAIAGNVLISFALNLQKMAHAQLERARAEYATAPEPTRTANAAEGMGTDTEFELGPPLELERDPRAWNANLSGASSLGPPLETEPLIPLPVTANAELQLSSQTYGALFPNPDDSHVDDSPLRRQRKVTKLSGTNGVGKYVREPRRHEPNNERQESEYLKSKIWCACPSFFTEFLRSEAQAFPRWLGFLLMNVGELGNFISYAFAPASVVAPLGTVIAFASCMRVRSHLSPVCSDCQLSLCSTAPP